MKNQLLIPLVFLSSLAGWTQSFTTSNLPIVVINTGGEEIPDDPKITVEMGIIYNGPGEMNSITDPFNHYQGPVGIETRGNSTQDFEKKTYSVELRTPAGEDSSAVLLGMPKEEDWILHAMVIDKTLLRIPMSFYLANQMGHYAANWRYCELVLDGEYRGVYILTERIKRDNGRVDIAKLKADDIEGDQLSGGYILRIDWLDEDFEGFETNKPSLGEMPLTLQYYYPRADKIQPEQVNYIRNYINEFQDALWSPTHVNDIGKHYSQYIDLTSFADFLIINELSKNSDGYKLSSYVHKDKTSNGGLLKAGPIWDFDQTYGMSVVCSCNDYTGWTYLQEQEGCEDFESMPLWWEKLMDDPVFTNHLKCRWETLRAGPLHLDSITNWMDTQRDYIQDGVDRNFELWEFLGEPIWAEPEPIPEDYEGEISAMKNWIENRLGWLDANMPGNCADDVVGLGEIRSAPELFVYPNPSSGLFQVSTSWQSFDYALYDIAGKQLLAGNSVNSNASFNWGHLPKGTYLLELKGDTERVIEKIVIH